MDIKWTYKCDMTWIQGYMKFLKNKDMKREKKCILHKYLTFVKWIWYF